MKSRYGVEYSILNKDCNNKRINTLNQKYGDYKSYLSKKSAESYIKNPPTMSYPIRTKYGNFKVRSKLELRIIKLLSELNLKSIKYEPFIIECKGQTIIPDLLINNFIIVEIKYDKFLNKNFIADRAKLYSMFKSAQTKIPLLKLWCEHHNYRFKIITDKDIIVKYRRQLLIDSLLSMTHQQA